MTVAGGRSHPALAAWAALGRPVPDAVVVQTLQDEPKCTVYRLHGLGPAGGDVVAKRTRRPLARREHLLLTSVLPGLGIPALACRGHLDAGPDSSWIFVDHCSGTPFRPNDPGHRVAAARWFARLHLRAADVPADPGVLDRRLDTYLDHLHSTRARVRAARSASVRAGAERVLLDSVVAGCDALESLWGHVQAACRSLPPTLVHGDARPGNLLVLSRGEGLDLVAIDWAEAGVGPAVVDLEHVDGATYWSVIGGTWGDVDSARAEQLGVIACTLQWLEAIAKVATALPEPSYADTARAQLGWFRDHLAQALPTISGASTGA